MEETVKKPASDKEWYYQQFTGERERFYRIFMRMLRKYGVTWSTASEKDRAFIEGISRFEMERELAKEKGLPMDTVKPLFWMKTASGESVPIGVNM